MTRQHILAAAFGLLSLLLLPSCLKDQRDLFQESSAVRLQQRLDSVATYLAAAPQGWRMEYFIGNVEQDRGGRNLSLEFNGEDNSVRVRSEEHRDSSFVSLYKLAEDDGPVLSFDSFNPLLHKYAVPSSSYYEARGGDFDFLIIRFNENEVELKGKRSGKTCRLYRLEEPAEDFINRMYDVDRSFYVSSFTGTIGGTPVTGEIDVRNRQFTVTEVLEDEDAEARTETLPYILTEKGLQFYKPTEFLGSTLDRMDYHPADTSFSAGSVTLKGYIPADWLPYSFFAGTYIFTHDGGSISIELTPEGTEEEYYRVKGLSDTFDLLFDYDIRSGRLNLSAQFAAQKGTEFVLMEGKDYILGVPLSTSGFFGTEDTYGFTAIWNQSEERPRFTWADKGLAPRFITEAFYLRLYNPSEGFVRDESGYTVAPRENFFKGNSSSLIPKSMSKANQ